MPSVQTAIIPGGRPSDKPAVGQAGGSSEVQWAQRVALSGTFPPGHGLGRLRRFACIRARRPSP
jgi:hypothetical protein